MADLLESRRHCHEHRFDFGNPAPYEEISSEELITRLLYSGRFCWHSLDRAFRSLPKEQAMMLVLTVLWAVFKFFLIIGALIALFSGIRNYWKNTITVVNDDMVLVVRPRGITGYVKYYWDKRDGWEEAERYSFLRGYFIFQKFRAGMREIPWQIHFFNELISARGMLAPALVSNQPEDRFFLLCLDDPTMEKPMMSFGEFQKSPQIQELKDSADRLYDCVKKMAESAIKKAPK